MQKKKKNTCLHNIRLMSVEIIALSRKILFFCTLGGHFGSHFDLYAIFNYYFSCRNILKLIDIIKQLISMPKTEYFYQIWQ